jgi:transglutaminase-like putative cysteine protease
MTWRRFTQDIRLAEVALAIVASAAGTLVYHRFFATPDYLFVLGLACSTGGLAAALGHRRTWVTPILAVAGLAVVMVYGVFRGDISAVPGGLRGSWNRLLTVTAPADTWGELLATPALVAWATAFSSVVLVLRTRNPLAPLAPSLAGFLFALFAVGNQAGGHLVATVVFLAAALVLVAVRTHRTTGDGTVRIERESSRPVVALVVAGSTVAVSALFGVVGGQVSPLASGDHRFDPRDLLAPPVASTDTLTPLSQLKKQLNESPPRPLFTVRTSPDPAVQVDRVRTAALDTFDGTTWTATDTYRVAGSHLTVDPELQHRRRVTARIELQELTGPYLPVIGWPSGLDTPGETRGRFGFDPESGVVVSTGSTSPGFSYDVTGEVYLWDKDLAQATPTAPKSPPLPAGVPEAVRALAASVTERNTTLPRERLSSLETALQVMGHRPNRPPGHSYAAIARALAEGDAGGGSAEQYAAAFTVIARMWGYPARVAVGYRLRPGKDGVFQVTTADAHAWSEVHFAGYGWVAYDPTRTDDEITRNPRPEAPRVVPPQPSPSTTAPVPAPRADSAPADAPDERGFRWDNILNGTWVLLPSLVLLVLLTSGLVVFGKAHRRRRRRRDPDHAARVLGAWREQLDRLAERGVSPPVSLTFHEVAQHVRAGIGDAADPIVATAELATRAIYAPEHLGQPEADQAWELVARLTAELYPRRLSAARLRAALDPRPLWTSWSVARRRRHAGERLETGRYR